MGAPAPVLRMIAEGLRLPWADSARPEEFAKKEATVNPEDQDFVGQELQRLLESGAIVRDESCKHICRARVVVGKKKRLVVDLRPINRYLAVPKVRFDTLRVMRQIVRKGDGLVTFDLKDGYHALSIHEADQRFLAFRIRGETYRCVAMPFGLAAAPWAFTKLMKVPIAFWRARGIRCAAYLDDFLAAGQRQLMARTGARMLADVTSLGLVVHPTKRQLHGATEDMVLGVRLETTKMIVSLPEEKRCRIRYGAARLLKVVAARARRVERAELESWLGLVSWAHVAVLEARLRSAAIFRAMTETQGRLVTLNAEAVRGLAWFAGLEERHCTRPIAVDCQDAEQLLSDASDTGWGAAWCAATAAEPVPENFRAIARQQLRVRLGVPWAKEALPQAQNVASVAPRVAQITFGYWPSRDRERPIMERELLAALYALRIFPLCPPVVLNVDNSAAMYAMASMTSRSAEVRKILSEIAGEVNRLRGLVAFRWLPSADNMLADSLSRFADHDDWRLRPDVYRHAPVPAILRDDVRGRGLVRDAGQRAGHHPGLLLEPAWDRSPAGGRVRVKLARTEVLREPALGADRKGAQTTKGVGSRTPSHRPGLAVSRVVSRPATSSDGDREHRAHAGLVHVGSDRKPSGSRPVGHAGVLLRTAARDWGATPAERDALEGLTRAAWASSTLAQYEMHMNAFVRWCEKEKVCSVPAEPASVARYLAALKMADKIHGDSVRSVVSAIRAMHSSVGLPSPTDDVMVRLIITGFQKAAVKKTAVAGRTRVPFMATRVVPLLRWFTALKTKEEWQWEVMGLLLFQYFFWARASTVAAVTAQDVQVRHDGIVFMERFAKGRGAARAAKPRRLVIPYRPTYQKMALQLQLDPIKVLATFILRQQARPGAELSLFWCKAVPRELASGLISREYQRLCDEAKIDLGLQEGQFFVQSLAPQWRRFRRNSARCGIGHSCVMGGLGVYLSDATLHDSGSISPGSHSVFRPPSAAGR